MKSHNKKALIFGLAAIILIISLSFVSAANTCTDTDGGRDYYLMGTISGTEWGTANYAKKTDFCITGETLITRLRLAEYFCLDNQIALATYPCPYGCSNGACVATPPTNFTEICTAEDLNKIRDNLSGNYKLVCDIDLKGWNWKPIGGTGKAEGGELSTPIWSSANNPYYFSGIFNGDGHTISNLVVSNYGSYSGLFSLSAGTIENINLVNIKATGSAGGGLVAANYVFGVVKNSSASGTIDGLYKDTSGNYTQANNGGLVGTNDGAIIDSHSDVIITNAASDVGGIAAKNFNIISNSYATGDLIDVGAAGGLVGSMHTKTFGDYTTLPIIEKSYATGNITNSGEGFVGGLVDFVASSTDAPAIIIDSYATGNVNSDRAFVGGLVGYAQGQDNGPVFILNSYSKGDVKGDGYVGGLIGAAESYIIIETSFASGDVNGASESGRTTTSGNYTGGLIGRNYGGDINNSFASGNVYGINYVGGLTGYSKSINYKNVYSVGNVKGVTYVGGLNGYNDTYYSGLITSGVITGGSSSILNSYWNTQTSGQSTSAGGTGRTTAEMMTKSNYVGWDFSKIWEITEGRSYPRLRKCSSNYVFNYVNGRQTGARYDVAWSDRTTITACCSGTAKCVGPDGKCYSNHQRFSGFNPGKNDNIADCEWVTSWWFDCDYDSVSCKDCKLKWVKSGEAKVFGEYETVRTIECCGDDAKEYYVTSRCPGVSRTTKGACCNSSKDKINSLGKCVSTC